MVVAVLLIKFAHVRLEGFVCHLTSLVRHGSVVKAVGVEVISHTTVCSLAKLLVVNLTVLEFFFVVLTAVRLTGVIVLATFVVVA